MQFSEKLDLLMNITKTTNSALAKNIMLDASHISRLRRGKRNALKDEACIRSMAQYFVKRCTEEYQQRALSDVLNLGQFSWEESRLSELLTQWLQNKGAKNTELVGTFLSGFASMENRQTNPLEQIPANSPAEPLKTDVTVFYGVAGRRQAALCFLSEILVQELPQTMLLFSDEPTEWMTGDLKFAAKWAMMMAQFLSKGNRIKIIHTVSRNLDEMLNAISQWMPLYMSGMIEPYYCPQKRDGVFRRTMFVVPGVCAIESNSVGNLSNQAASMFFRDPNVIDTLEEEFNGLLKLCKPLMHIYTSTEEKPYYHTLLEFEQEPGNVILKTESLSLLTMPQEVTDGIALRTGTVEEHFCQLQAGRREFFEQNVRSHSVIELIHPYSPSDVINGEVKVALSDMLSGGAAHYTAEEYILHLEHLLWLLKTYQNFHVGFIPETEEDRYLIYAREDLGVIVGKTSAPPIVLMTKEANLTAAFWGFLKSLLGKKQSLDHSNRESVKKLTDYIKKLKKAVGDQMEEEESAR